MEPSQHIVILAPVFNDWSSCQQLLVAIHETLSAHRLTASVVIVDDGSTEPCTLALDATKHTSLKSLHIVELRRNLGHQRAIAIGLSHVAATLPDLPVLVMDSDGQDKPADIPPLHASYVAEGGHKAIFARRVRRSESRAFRIGYQTYRFLHHLLVGKSINYGNFSLLPPRLVQQIVGVSELWNHYAAALMKSRLPFTSIPTDRADRLDGSSKMNYTGLVLHGLSALSVYADLIGVRVLTYSLVLLVTTAIAFLVTGALHLFTHVPIPNWTWMVTGMLFLFAAQIASIVAVFVFMILFQRSGPQFMPLRDYQLFIARMYELIE